MTGTPRALYAGQLFGFPVYVHASLAYLAPLFLLGAVTAGDTGSLIDRMARIPALLIAVLARELAHAQTARQLGIPVKHIEVTAFGGYAAFMWTPNSRTREALIAVAGPLANLILGGAALLAYRLLSPTPELGYANGFLLIPDATPNHWLTALSAFAWINLGLGLFNLLPGLPLDGGHILRAGLSALMPRSRAGGIAAWCGTILALVIAAFGYVFESLWTILIAGFIAVSAYQDLRRTQYE